MNGMGNIWRKMRTREQKKGAKQGRSECKEKKEAQLQENDNSRWGRRQI